MKIIVIVLFFLSLVSAVEVDISCPKEVSVNEEFSCDITPKDLSGTYDVKIEILKDDKTVAMVWNPSEEKWVSAYYYLKEYLDDSEKKIKIKVSEEGEYDSILKIRQGETREFFEFDLIVEGNPVKEEKESKDIQKEETQTISKSFDSPEEPKSVIPLNDISNISSKNSKTEVIYESKSYRVMKYVPYAFSLFLIFIIAILFREKF